MKIAAEIPARAGSQRVKNKNLRLINGHPLISYAIKAAINSTRLNEVYVNTESDDIGECAIAYGAKYFKRDEALASNTAKQEDFNYDFILKTDPDILVMINPVCPLIDSNDIDNVINYYLENDFDTVITTNNMKLQTFYLDKPVNINPHEILQPTQDLEPVKICNWAVTIWKTSSFKESFEKNGYAAFNGKLGFYPISPLKSVKISYEEDFMLAEAILSSSIKQNTREPEYYKG